MKNILIIIALALAVSNCKNIPGSTEPQVSSEILDTITSTTEIVASPAYFETLFTKGKTKTDKGSAMNFYGLTIGKLKISSGRIVACDPMHMDEYGIPFTQIFPTGEFPVQLSVLELNGEEAIAFARIKFSEQPVVKWKLALQKGQSDIPVGSEAIHGYNTDSSVGIFIDAEAAKALDHQTVSDTDGAVYAAMEKHSHGGWQYAMYNFEDYNLSAFTTGVGSEGPFATYIGFDAKGQPCRLVTDFNLFDWKSRQQTINNKQ